MGASFHKCLSERSKLRYGMCRCETRNVVYITSFQGCFLEYHGEERERGGGELIGGGALIEKSMSYQGHLLETGCLLDTKH